MHKRDKWTCLPQPLSALHQSKLFRDHSSGNLCETEDGRQEEKLPSVSLPNFGTSWHGNLRLHEHTLTLKNYSKLNQGNEERAGNLLKSGTLILLMAQVFLIFPPRLCRFLQVFSRLLPNSPTDVLGCIFPPRGLVLAHLKHTMTLDLFSYNDHTLITTVCVKMRQKKHQNTTRICQQLTAAKHLVKQ